MMRYFLPRHVICRMLYRWRRWDADSEPIMSEVHYWTGSEWLRMDRDHIPAGAKWDRLIEPKHAYMCLKGARHA